MADTCPAISRGEGEADVLLKLLRRSGVLDKDIDTGVLRSNFKQNRSSVERVPGTAGDGKLSPNEILGGVKKKLEEEENKFVDIFVKTGRKSQRPFADLVSRCSTYRDPSLFYNFDAKTRTAKDVFTFLGIAAKIAAIRKSIRRYKPDTFEFNNEFAKKLVAWMEQKLSRIDYIEVESTNLQMANGALGDCTELSRFAHAVFRLAGFKPEFLKITRNAVNPKIKYHMAVGVPLDPDNPDFLTHVDLYHKDFMKRGLRHPGWLVVSRQTMLAIGEVTEALHIIRKAPPSTTAQSLFNQTFKHYSRALTFDEHFPDAHYHAALSLFNIGKIKLARLFNKRALEINPNLEEALKLHKRLNPQKTPR